MNMFLIILTCLSFTMQTIAMKSVKASGLRQNLLITSLLASMVAVGFWCYGFFTTVELSPFSIFMGIIFGGVYTSTMVFYYYAMQTGSLSYSTFFYSASMIIPSLAGTLIWAEPFTSKIVIGLILFLIAFYLIAVPKSDKSVPFSKKWIMFCFLSWLGNGCCGLTIKIHQMQMSGQEGIAFMTIGYTSAAVISILIFFLLKAKQKGALDGKLIKTSVLFLVIAAVGNGGGNALVTYLSSRVESAYLFPTVLGGMLILVTLYSAIMLKEKLSRNGIIGIALGMVAIIFMNL